MAKGLVIYDSNGEEYFNSENPDSGFVSVVDTQTFSGAQLTEVDYTQVMSELGVPRERMGITVLIESSGGGGVYGANDPHKAELQFYGANGVKLVMTPGGASNVIYVIVSVG